MEKWRAFPLEPGAEGGLIAAGFTMVIIFDGSVKRHRTMIGITLFPLSGTDDPVSARLHVSHANEEPVPDITSLQTVREQRRLVPPVRCYDLCRISPCFTTLSPRFVPTYGIDNLRTIFPALTKPNDFTSPSILREFANSNLTPR